MRIEHPYEFVQGTTPLLISMPHPGLLLPDEVAGLLTSEARALPDTDWHIPQLYGFAAKMGASLVMARYSRFAVDLNRPEDDTPLYQTATTGLFPDILFDGTSIFRPGAARSDEIKTACKERIWRPYHGKLMAELNRIKGEFGHAVLLDAHSIRGEIPRLFDGLLPDFNIGTNDGKSCAKSLSRRGRDRRATPPATATSSTAASRAATSPATTASPTARSTPCSWSWRSAPT